MPTATAMGSPRSWRRTVRSRGAAVAIALPALWALPALLTGCAPAPEEVLARRAELLAHGADRVEQDLARALDRLDATLAGLGDALERADQAGASPFDALEALRCRQRVDGVLWEGPGGEDVWAGRPIEPLAQPPPPPWEGSFRRGPLAYHHGPFLKALTLGPVPVRGGLGTATVILEEKAPEERVGEPFAERWLTPLELQRVTLRPPAAPEPLPPQDAEARRELTGPDGTPWLAVAVRARGPDAVRDELLERRQRHLGWTLLAVLAVLVAGAARGLRGRRHARAGGVGLILLTRAGLGWVGLGRLLPGLEAAFSPAEFAVATPLGWLASPADFALTALTWLAVVAWLARGGPAPAGRGGAVRAAAGVLLAALAVAGWLALVDAAVTGGETPFFAATAFVPAAPQALLLCGLVAAAAATWLLCGLGLSLGARTPGLSRRLLRGLLGGAGAFFLAQALGDCHPLAALVPLLAALVPVPAPGATPFLGLPGRIVILSVLASLLTGPVLWTRVGERDTEGLEAVLEHRLAQEDLAQAGVRAALDDARGDPTLGAALRAAAEGVHPEGLAFFAWRRAGAFVSGQPLVVHLLDARGRLIEHFSLAPVPTAWLAPAQPPLGPEDAQVLTARADGERVRSVVGRLRVRGAGGETLGHVVYTVPDLLELELRGLVGLVRSLRPAGAPALARSPRLQYAALAHGVVVASSDPAVARDPGAFGPAALGGLGPARPELRWDEADSRGYARYDAERGVALAVRLAPADLADAMLALARLILVGVGLGVSVALLCLLGALPRLRLRLHHKILLSYFLISVIPLLLLGWASARESQARHERQLSERLQTDVARVRSELERMGASVFDDATSNRLEEWAPQRGHEVLLYRQGELAAASRPGLVQAELLARRLPANVYRASVLERREVVRQEAVYAGRPVWFGYAPVLDPGTGLARATVGVPLLYDRDRVEEEVVLTGSVLLAAYLLTLVLVLVGGIVAARNLAHPLDELAAGTRRVAAGELDLELPGEGSDELGQLVRAFNAMTRDLRAATERAARAEREGAWRRMARQVAHEIKNPLTPMRLMVQQLEADVARDPSTAREAIRRTAQVILKQIQGLDRIAGDFANFARLPQRDLVAVDVVQLLREVEVLHSGARAEGVEVRSEIPADLPRVRWDEQELRRVLLNVVGNALEAVGPGGRVEIRARAEARGPAAGVRIDVSDTGPGIAPADLPRLFEPHFSTKTAGTGLGLAIVRGILDDMGGRIEVHSRPGEGATFRLWWPADGAPPA